jgi:L-2-hydroxyglutarate oxidase LhgO
LYAWADEHAVRTRRLGKLIVAFDEDEAAALQQLAQAAEANGVPGLRMMDGQEVRSLEPAIHTARALYSGTSGVVDQMGLMRSYFRAARSAGAHFAFRHAVTQVLRSGGGFVLAGPGPHDQTFRLAAGAVVNAAGLGADRIGSLAGYDRDGGPAHPAFRQYVNKGRYYDVVSGEGAPGISHLVYPLPHEGREGLGVHLTPDIDGGLHLGPDAEWLDEREPLDFRAADDRRQAFLHAARRYLPRLEGDDLQPGQVGYRPKLSGPGQAGRDFLIFADRGYIHLGGIESPGLTASLAIAHRVVALLPGGAPVKEDRR